MINLLLSIQCYPLIGHFYKGIYDNLPYGWSKEIFDCKKQIFNFCNFGMTKKEKNESFSLLFFNYIYSLMNVKISKLMIDVVEQTSGTSFQLGAAIILSKQPSLQVQSTTQASSSSEINLSSLQSSTDPNLDSANLQCVMNVHIDELINIACDLKIPVHIDKKLYQQCCIDAVLKDLNYSNENRSDSVSDSTTGTNDKKAMKIEGVASAVAQPRDKDMTTDKDRDITRVWEIYDPKQFLRMNTFEKRKLLRDSGTVLLLLL